MGTLISSKGTHKSLAKCAKRMAEGGDVTADGDRGDVTVEGDRGDHSRERVYTQTGADPRSGIERLAGLVNRVVSGNMNAPVRQYSDDPTKMAMNRRASQKRK